MILLILVLFSLKSNLTYSAWTLIISVILQIREGEKPGISNIDWLTLLQPSHLFSLGSWHTRNSFFPFLLCLLPFLPRLHSHVQPHVHGFCIFIGNELSSKVSGSTDLPFIQPLACTEQ